MEKAKKRVGFRLVVTLRNGRPVEVYLSTRKNLDSTFAQFNAALEAYEVRDFNPMFVIVTKSGRASFKVSDVCALEAIAEWFYDYYPGQADF